MTHTPLPAKPFHYGYDVERGLTTWLVNIQYAVHSEPLRGDCVNLFRLSGHLISFVLFLGKTGYVREARENALIRHRIVD